MKKYVITYDIGTTGIKTCLIEIEDTMRILASATAGYNLYVDDETGVKGGAEQDADEWWAAMCSTTRTVFDKMPTIKKEQVEGISFCSAMQGLVLVDKEGKCIRRPMTYMDQRAREELKKGMAHGVQIAGAEVTKLLKYLKYTGAVSSLKTLFGSTDGLKRTSLKISKRFISGLILKNILFSVQVANLL